MPINTATHAIRLAVQHDYAAFAALELEERRAHGHPPWKRLLRVVVRSKDDEAVVGSTLEAVFAQTHRPLEVLNVDSGSTDATPAIVARYPCRRFHLPAREYVPGRVLNWMAREARGEILVFLNSDATPLDDAWLERLLEVLERDPGVGGVYGRQIARSGASPSPAPCRRRRARPGTGCARCWARRTSRASSSPRASPWSTTSSS